MSKPELTDRACMTHIFGALCKAVGSPVALASWALYSSNTREGHHQLAEKRVNPRDYTTSDAFWGDYLVTSYLSKWKGLETGIDTERVALESFANSEKQCLETNRRLRDVANGHAKAHPMVEPVLLLASQKIADILGPCDYVKALSRSGWGRGATATLKGAEAILVNKIGPKGTISVTSGALSLAKAVIESDPHWLSAICDADVEGPCCLLDNVFHVVNANRVVTVPKDATKDRTIAAEPTLNIFLQLGVGRYIRGRLKRFGVDLNDQTHNQRGAKLGSLTGDLATLDLKSASDTVSKELIRQLLPLEWSLLLDQLRAPKGVLPDGSEVLYEKYSSMGNGFTFELESLVFYALCRSVLRQLGLRGRALVYGDDLIVPVGAVPLLREVLTFCGFTLNERKSYWDGYFRESCGKHYWNGTDVTPIYQKEGLVRNGRPILEEAYRCANRFIRLAYSRGGSCFLDKKLKGPYDATIRLLLPAGGARHTIPLDDESDDGLLCTSSQLKLIRRRGAVSMVEHGRITLPVYSFVPLKLALKGQAMRALYAYWHRYWPEEPFKGKLSAGRRGYYVSQRRTYPIGTPDVDWM